MHVYVHPYTRSLVCLTITERYRELLLLTYIIYLNTRTTFNGGFVLYLTSSLLNITLGFGFSYWLTWQLTSNIPKPMHIFIFSYSRCAGVRSSHFVFIEFRVSITVWWYLTTPPFVYQDCRKNIVPVTTSVVPGKSIGRPNNQRSKHP